MTPEDDLLEKEFVPCVSYDEEADFTEIVLRDCAVINRQLAPGFSAGFDMETGDLVLLRAPGDLRKRK